LVPYKKIDVIVDAFSKLPDRRLIVVGDGPEAQKIQQKAGPNVKVMGHQSAESLLNYMQRARAFIFAAEEDFGIVPVEAQACGTPVIAFGRGGAIESVVDGRTGLLFAEQTPECIAETIHEFERRSWNPEIIRENARRFSIEHFRRDLANHVRSEWANFCRQRPTPCRAAPLSDHADRHEEAINAIAE
jgi:glycosyltransferase involved in cell wall biosynthesis